MKTAIEWLVSEFSWIDWDDPYYRAKLEEAKEMEKQQMGKVWEESRIEDMRDVISYLGPEKTFDKYYAETFKNKEK